MMIKIEEIREIVKESPLFDKCGSEKDITEIIERIFLSFSKDKVSDKKVGKVYVG